MFARRFFAFTPLLLLLSGCTGATRVSPPSSLAPAQPDSLARALNQLDGKTIGALIARSQKAPVLRVRSNAAPPSPSLRPLSTGPAPAQPLPVFSLAKDDAFTLSPAAPSLSQHLDASPETALVREPARTLVARTESTGAPSDDLNPFMRGWAARQSLVRADEELLERRALNNRIALVARTPLPELNPSLVPPDVQLRLTNLRLQLLPLQAARPAEQARAQEQINAIEAQLRQVWESEAARQAALLQRQTREIPTRLTRDGEAALALQTRQRAQKDEAARERLLQSAQGNLSLTPPLAPLRLYQDAALAPNARAQTSASFAALATRERGKSPLLAADKAPLATPHPLAVPASAARQERVWRAATR